MSLRYFRLPRDSIEKHFRENLNIVEFLRGGIPKLPTVEFITPLQSPLNGLLKDHQQENGFHGRKIPERQAALREHPILIKRLALKGDKSSWPRPLITPFSLVRLFEVRPVGRGKPLVAQFERGFDFALFPPILSRDKDMSAVMESYWRSSRKRKKVWDCIVLTFHQRKVGKSLNDLKSVRRDEKTRRRNNTPT
ncbi:hypothetical protein CDAR_263321 [Caerostris darwini]|uniref:Uncharacterized protein n=1 Tax=Caerostris darwini TaxID=1538125 RepID=A0AAV4RZ53_9ARAC|nr:hypothetical protein CDAR_263321 [Caerostris darwini]